VLDTIGEPRRGLEDLARDLVEDGLGCGLPGFDDGGLFEEAGDAMAAGKTSCDQRYDQKPDTDDVAGFRPLETQLSVSLAMGSPLLARAARRVP
jgi:hypothetical protein